MSRENYIYSIFPEVKIPTINYLGNLSAIYFSEIFKNLLDMPISLIEANVSVRQSVKKVKHPSSIIPLGGKNKTKRR